MKVKEIYFNDNRLFAILEFVSKEGTIFCFPYYRSSGTNMKEGRHWGGEWFPILMTDSVQSQELEEVRMLIYGNKSGRPGGYDPNKDWINKGSFKNDFTKAFFVQNLHTGKLLLDSINPFLKYWDEYKYQDHHDIYNKYRNEINICLGFIRDNINTLLKQNQKTNS